MAKPLVHGVLTGIWYGSESVQLVIMLPAKMTPFPIVLAWSPIFCSGGKFTVFLDHRFHVTLDSISLRHPEMPGDPPTWSKCGSAVSDLAVGVAGHSSSNSSVTILPSVRGRYNECVPASASHTFFFDGVKHTDDSSHDFFWSRVCVTLIVHISRWNWFYKRKDLFLSASKLKNVTTWTFSFIAVSLSGP